MMTLAEALKASKHREAYGFPKDNNGGSRFIPTALGRDGGVELLSFDSQTGFIQEVKKSWAELLPHEREAVMDLDWEPIDPKHPLIQLAETLTDWSDDDEEDPLP